MIKARRCFNCLRTNHKTRECLSTRMCRLYQQKHHQSICSSLSKKIEPFVLNSLPPVTSNSGDSTETSNHTTSDKNTKTVLLQTARAVAYNPETGFSTKVRILFDRGSQRSYIIDQLCSRLKLTPVHVEKPHLGVSISKQNGAN